MLFNSFSFAVFFPIVFLLYWALPSKFRWIMLLLSSYYFYMSWNVKYVALILFTTGVSYSAAILLEKAGSQKRRRMILRLSILACLSALFVFKYFNFFFDSISRILRAFSIRLSPVTLKLLLPVGISFYTFQTISYVIDVYRGKIKAEKNFGIYATFVSFFPQLVAGPIERTENLLPQIKEARPFSYDKAIYGLKLMAWGYFKKIVVADKLAVYVDKIYGDLPQYDGFALVLATLFFTAQIYCDFSGYSDIARGAAKLLNIDLMQNFKSPYFSASVREFWSRWHISLSTWFRDYIYIPLGGNRASKFRRSWNLLITFLLSGLWHGADWTFLLWGGVHALARIAESLLGIRPPEKEGVRRALRTLAVFCFVALAWVFFRAESVSDALYVFRHMADGIANPMRYVRDGIISSGMTVRRTAYFCLAYFLPLAAFDGWERRTGGDAIRAAENRNAVLQWLFYLAFGAFIVFFSPKGATTEFIYFQF